MGSRIAWLACLLMAATSAIGAPETTRPAALAPANRIHRTADSGAAKLSQPGAGGQGASAGAAQVVLSLAAVVGLILLLYWGSKRLLPRGAMDAGAHPIRVLSRVAVSSKQRILLIKIGRRLLIVADSGQRLSTLCEIDEPAEVSELIEQLNTRGRENGVSFPWRKTGARSAVMRSTREDAQFSRADGLDEASHEIRGLLHRVRGMAQVNDQ